VKVKPAAICHDDEKWFRRARNSSSESILCRSSIDTERNGYIRRERVGRVDETSHVTNWNGWDILSRSYFSTHSSLIQGDAVANEGNQVKDDAVWWAMVDGERQAIRVDNGSTGGAYAVIESVAEPDTATPTHLHTIPRNTPHTAGEMSPTEKVGWSPRLRRGG
jgi:hypothetical protein